MMFFWGAILLIVLGIFFLDALFLPKEKRRKCSRGADQRRARYDDPLTDPRYAGMPGNIFTIDDRRHNDDQYDDSRYEPLGHHDHHDF